MDAGLVTALSGALAQSKQVERIANNIANADTAGFKADELVFEAELQGQHHREMSLPEIPERVPTSSEIFSKAGDEHRVALYGTEFTDLRAGNIKRTGNALDIAIEGNGFLEVAHPNGVRLTRAGNLTLDAQGRLATRDGFLVLGPGQAQGDPAARAINLGTSNVTIDAQGNIYGGADLGGAQLGSLGLVQVADPSQLKKSGQGLFEAPEAALLRPGAPAALRLPAQAGGANTKNPLGSTQVPPRIHQGMIEGSNVNPVKEMSRMIEAQRLYEQNAKLMQTFGNIQASGSELGKF
jgi:flagellar basal-body rod protein FlgF